MSPPGEGEGEGEDAGAGEGVGQGEGEGEGEGATWSRFCERYSTARSWVGLGLAVRVRVSGKG